MGLSDEVQFFAATDVGRKREHNEDNFLVDSELRLFVVADGMGGHAAGEVASAIAVRTMHQVVNEQRDVLADALADPAGASAVLEILKRGVQTASRKVFAAAERDSSKRGMGTTMSVLLIGSQHGYIAHVGDSRVYLLRKLIMQQLTDDHTVANELLRLGMVTEEELDKVPKKNSITRAVGVYEHVEVDALTVDVLPGDQFVLASDGLTGYLDETDTSLFDFTAEQDGEKAVSQLIAFANGCGGKDNVTVLLVRVGGEVETQRATRIAMTHVAMQNTPLFAKLSERERLHVLQIATCTRFAAGEVVVRKGDIGNDMFLTVAGKLRVSIDDTELRILEPGDHFGEMALLAEQPRAATVTAVDVSDVLVFRRDRFFELIRGDSHVAVKLLWQFLAVLSQRLLQTSHDLRDAQADAIEPGSTAPPTTEDPFSAPDREALKRLRYSALQSKADEPISPSVESSAVDAPPPLGQRRTEASSMGRSVARETVPARGHTAAQKTSSEIPSRSKGRDRPTRDTRKRTADFEQDDMKATRRRVPNEEDAVELDVLRANYKKRLEESRSKRKE
jgi:serine/threonine protein phosphatase PrpC